VGAKVKVKTKDLEVIGVVNAFSLRYKKDKAFVTTIKVIGGKE
jgi:hypothetical protein